MHEYITVVTGEPLESLWAMTSGLCAQNKDVRWMQSAVDAIRQTEEAQAVEQLSNNLAGELKTIVQRNANPDDPSMELMDAYFDLLEIEDKQFMREMRLALRAGIQVFEEFERDTISQGNARLLEAAGEIPSVLEAYYARVFSGIQVLEDGFPHRATGDLRRL